MTRNYIVGDEGEELYDLASDPGEIRDLSAEAEGQLLIESLRDRLEQVLSEAGE